MSDSNLGNALLYSDKDVDIQDWILDPASTDHMTYDAKDFLQTSTPQCTCIANGNMVISPVTGADTVMLSPTLSLSHILLVPCLSHKLLYVGQVTKTLTYVVHFYLHFSSSGYSHQEDY